MNSKVDTEHVDREREESPRKSFVLVLMLALAAVLLPGCVLEMPILHDSPGHVIDLDQFPAGTELVEIEGQHGVRLRGVFVPACRLDAPVVLHLLRSGGSVTEGHEQRVLWQLSEMGLSSLMVDYRGVGSSDGSRTPSRLPDDARLLWQEALRRTGGDPHRILVRGTSVGSLVAASLLRDGVHPAGVSLVAPVRAESMAANFLAPRMPGFVAWLTLLPFRQALDVDIVGVLGRNTLPLVVYSSDGDYYLPGTETELMRQAVLRNGGRWVTVTGTHFETAIRALQLLPTERSFFAAATTRATAVAGAQDSPKSKRCRRPDCCALGATANGCAPC